MITKYTIAGAQAQHKAMHVYHVTFLIRGYHIMLSTSLGDTPRVFGHQCVVCFVVQYHYTGFGDQIHGDYAYLKGLYAFDGVSKPGSVPSARRYGDEADDRRDMENP
jgi:hypothetical protein